MKLRALFLCVSLLNVIGCNAAPFALEKNGDSVQIDVSTLGEYPTTVRRIRILDTKSDTVVWEFSPDSTEVPQIWRFTLRAGANPCQLESTFGGRKYRVVTPSNQSQFLLRKDVVYRLEMWGESRWMRNSRRFSF
jgi:hypothetical protein